MKHFTDKEEPKPIKSVRETIVEPFRVQIRLAMQRSAKNMNSLAITAFFLSVAGGALGDDKAANTKLPPKVAELQSALVGKNRQEAYEITRKQFGKPARDVGSGFCIKQWDVGGGIISFHETLGPTFRDEAGSITWLIATRNEVGANLHAGFEMYSLKEQDPYKKGNRYWLGNLELYPSGKFEYRDSGQHHKYKKQFPRHFFADHLEGEFDIEYSEGVFATDALEDVGDGKRICRITFRSGSNSQTFGIITSHRGRSLRFDSEDQVFEMNRGWNRYWPEKPKKAQQDGGGRPATRPESK